MRRLLQNMSVNGRFSQEIQEKKQLFLVSGTVFVAHLFEVRSITVIDFSCYFALIQACCQSLNSSFNDFTNHLLKYF